MTKAHLREGRQMEHKRDVHGWIQWILDALVVVVMAAVWLAVALAVIQSQ
jgi:hypothetical protein